jgi:hypothetical protein
MTSRLIGAMAVGLVAVGAAACSSPPGPPAGSGTTTMVPSTSSTGSTTPSSTAPSTAPGSAPRTDAAGTVWLCRPGLADDPCAGDLDATSVLADGSATARPATPAATSKFDCFYVYPTVSNERGDNANLKVQGVEIAAAVSQAARFSEDCEVWAPLYRQRTESSLQNGLGNDPAADAIAYASLLSGWEDYLAHDNDGRPVVFIGHSQGAAMLIRLLRSQIDPDPALRRRLVSAIILGGNVQVPTGGDVGGSFQHIPGCRSAGQTGCVIAYSSFPAQPPAASEFGRPGAGVSLQSGQTASAGMQVLCTNPADLAGGSGALDPYFPTTAPTGAATTVTTPWVEYPDLYTAQCQTSGGATWLQVNDIASAGDHRPRVSEVLGPTWGFHLDDVNLALGNLVQVVSAQEAAYR